jgi:hypothetical protein
MILPFSTQLNGKPTYFVEKIISCLALNRLITFDEATRALSKSILKVENKDGSLECFEFSFDNTQIHRQKLHTIREDKNNRWKAGKIIDFFINCRQKNMFRFAPKLPVVSTQIVEIKYDDVFGKQLHPDIIIDGIRLHPEKIEEFSQNDGFDTVDEFLQYFNEDFEGKIIHWTDKRY